VLAVPVTAAGGGKAGLAGGVAGVRPDLCLRPDCYGLKVAAVARGIAEEAKRRGCELMDPGDGAALFDKGQRKSAEVLGASGYVALGAKCDPTLAGHYNEDKMPTWGELLERAGGFPGTRWLVKAPNGELVEVVLWQDAVRCVQAGAGTRGFLRVEGMETAGDAAAAADLVEPEVPKMTAEGDLVEPRAEVVPKGWDEAANRRLLEEARLKRAADEAAVMAKLMGMWTGLKGLVQERDLDVMETWVGDAEAMVAGPEGMRLLRKLPFVRNVEGLADEFRLEVWEDYVVLGVMMYLSRCMAQWGMGWKGWEEWYEVLGVKAEEPVPALEVGMPVPAEKGVVETAVDLAAEATAKVELLAELDGLAEVMNVGAECRQEWLDAVATVEGIRLSTDEGVTLGDLVALRDAAKEVLREMAPGAEAQAAEGTEVGEVRVQEMEVDVDVPKVEQLVKQAKAPKAGKVATVKPVKAPKAGKVATVKPVKAAKKKAAGRGKK
jgi:hypothetical protein